MLLRKSKRKRLKTSFQVCIREIPKASHDMRGVFTWDT